MAWTAEYCEEIWAMADKDGSGTIDIDELDAALCQHDKNVTPKQTAMIFSSLDSSGDKKISRDEFFKEMVQKTERSEGMKKMFTEFDKDGNGSLTKDELRKLIENFFEPNCVDNVYAKFIEVSDASGDGKISYDEFLSFFG